MTLLHTSTASGQISPVSDGPTVIISNLRWVEARVLRTLVVVVSHVCLRSGDAAVRLRDDPAASLGRQGPSRPLRNTSRMPANLQQRHTAHLLFAGLAWLNPDLLPMFAVSAGAHPLTMPTAARVC